MKEGVSKVRSKRAKKRDKEASKGSDTRYTLHNSPLLRFVIGTLLWLGCVLIMEMGTILSRDSGLAEVMPALSSAVFLFSALLISGVLLSYLCPEMLHRNSRILMLALISLLSIAAAKTIFYLSDTLGPADSLVVQFMIPVAIGPLLTTILAGGRAGLSVGLFTSLACATLSAQPIPALVTGGIATVISVHTAQRVRTRTRVFRIGITIGLAQSIAVLGLTALQWESATVMSVVRQAAACLLSGFVSATVVLLILPLFELLFKVTTDITLLEMSDLGHPLLQRLAIEAPGTYHHSLVVANLAQAAADEIDADSLLARVCAYFHDVGKLTKPDFFSENIHMRPNPHDDLPPSMSTLVITAHVKEGISLALLHKLPPPILQVIREHHGTSLISCFHHKARSMVAEDTQAGAPTNAGQKVEEGAFRYSGPTPSTKESAIICLADAVEAASRSMEKTTPNHIEGLVSSIISERIRDGQLDRAELTLEQLTRVKRAFVFTLTNMLHGRVPYPKDEDSNSKPSKTSQAESTDDQEPAEVPARKNATPEPE